MAPVTTHQGANNAATSTLDLGLGNLKIVEDQPSKDNNDDNQDDNSSDDEETPYTWVNKPKPFKGEFKDIDRFVIICKMTFELQLRNFINNRRKVLFAASHF
ncbi:MAG: hypothetical protein M1829_001300, partial [Trizodia sp. TS-e1964]